MDDEDGPLTAFDEAIQEAIEELKGAAFSDNIDRPHHRRSAVECFEEIGILLKAQKIVHETIFPEGDEG